MDSLNRIHALIDMMIDVCDSWIQDGKDGHLRFIDPNDKEEISAHYGATHAAAALIIWGRHMNNDVLYQKGLALLDSILSRWDENSCLYAYHYDFNNFALTLIEGFVGEEVVRRIRHTVLTTCDSPHDTINWLPMRWAVNKKRVEWTKKGEYNQRILHCKSMIAKATNADGGIEDRLPHGMSFNLQYDLATVAVLQYLRVQGETIDLSKELGFLLNAVAPDGDINYQGRGTNQIFAWGLWLYLLSSSKQSKALNIALKFLEPKLPVMLAHGNIMLNEWSGKDKYLWWDYHYTSVYTAHCLLWMVLAYVDADKAEIKPTLPTTTETGLHIYKSDKAFVSWFEGRSEYLAENGPVISAIWTKKNGMICKGTFGPWQGLFGNKYIYEGNVIMNFCGILSVKRNKDYTKHRIFHRLFPSLKSIPMFALQPLFIRFELNEHENNLMIEWKLNKNTDIIFCLPSYKSDQSFELVGMENKLQCVSSVKNQYGWSWRYQSKVVAVNNVRLIIPL